MSVKSATKKNPSAEAPGDCLKNTHLFFYLLSFLYRLQELLETDFWITGLFELSDESGTDYYVTLESADETVILKSVSDNSWSRYKKLSK